MSYTGETSMPLHFRINKYASSIIYNKSTVELKHFNLHKSKNATIEILKIH